MGESRERNQNAGVARTTSGAHNNARTISGASEPRNEGQDGATKGEKDGKEKETESAQIDRRQRRHKIQRAEAESEEGPLGSQGRRLAGENLQKTRENSTVEAQQEELKGRRRPRRGEEERRGILDQRTEE